MKSSWKDLAGEFIGTYIMVFIGCGTVGLAVIFGTFTQLWQVAALWGFAVALAIYSVRKFSPAHFNPAVSLAMVLAGKLNAQRLPAFVLIQLVSAFSAAASLYLLFSPSIAQFELQENIERGTITSQKTAMMFGEFYPNPGSEGLVVSTFQASLLEGLATCILVFVIFRVVQMGARISTIAPVLIGATVSLLIMAIAPYTQAGINPARDFGPRIFASIAGWGDAAFPTPSFGFFTVYILGPFLGGVLAVVLNNLFMRLNK